MVKYNRFNDFKGSWSVAVLALLAAGWLVSCQPQLANPPARYGFYRSDQPWQLIGGGGTDGLGTPSTASANRDNTSGIAEITPDAEGRFTIWAYHDPPVAELTVHLAVVSLAEEIKAYDTAVLLEPVGYGTADYAGGKQVTKFVFQVSANTYRTIFAEQDPTIQGRLALKSPQLDLTYFTLGDCPLADQARAAMRPPAKPPESNAAPPKTGQQSHSAADRPDAPLEPVYDTAGALEFSYPVMPYGPGTYEGRSFGAENKSAGLPPVHLGEAVALAPGTPVRAAAAGRVVLSAAVDGYGWVVVLEHELRDGTLLNTIYGHLSAREGFGAVESGKYLDRGQLVGCVGWPDEYPPAVGSGNGGAGPHLHMGLRVVGAERDYEPGVAGAWLRFDGTADDLGSLGQHGEHTGGAYLAYSQFMRRGYNAYTIAARSDISADVNLE
ncbi:M23 family metallopeptidase [bacterium]|nr:M23 family metallopeptidase [bacterium]